MFEALKSFIINSILSIFTGTFSIVQDINELIRMSPQGYNSEIFDLMRGISQTIIPIALVIGVICFYIELVNKTMMFEIVTIENVAKILMRFVFAKVCIDHSFNIMVAIFQGVTQIVDKITNYTEVDIVMDIDSVATQIQAMKGGEVIGFLAFASIFGFVMWATRWVIFLIVYGRIMELYILFALSPLPIATMAGEGLHDIAKKFIQKFIAVSLQGVIMVVILAVYGKFISVIKVDSATDVVATLGSFVLMGLVLALTMFKSGTWAKEFVGLG